VSQADSIGLRTAHDLVAGGPLLGDEHQCGQIARLEGTEQQEVKFAVAKRLTTELPATVPMLMSSEEATLQSFGQAIVDIAGKVAVKRLG
jgi:hypothetical protein